ncbi:FecR family protein [Pedobacter hartonius]|uniref:FecR family protein n=1 Tax=Pedobacter hartonius TaxID=425514 RepID=UPI001C316211
MNAGSSLTFPKVFDASERKVTLKGEAYFEVAKVYTSLAKRTVRMPFSVQTGESEVEVLGTHFNVMAYPDAVTQKTTLLEGSVRVNHGAQDHRKRKTRLCLAGGTGCIYTLAGRTADCAVHFRF